MSCYNELNHLIDNGCDVLLVTALKGGSNNCLSGNKLLFSGGEIICSNFDQQTSNIIKNKLSDYESPKLSRPVKLTIGEHGNCEIFVHVYERIPRLHIFGGGHVGAAVCRVAQHLDFEIVIVDDRPDFADRHAHPQAHRIICESFDKAFDLLKPGLSDYLVIVTRGHKHDLLCLKKSMLYQIAYLGMIGSRKRVKTQLDELKRAGYPQERLAAVHTPIGLNIGAVTEPEIAISILAEIIQVRRGQGRDESYQPGVLKELVKIEKEKKSVVLATIIKTSGSTPRKTGSQMIIAADGSVKGTIGGGFCEADVIKEALFCLDNGVSKRLYYDLNADTAAEEGMACGGTMDIYLELLKGV